MNGAKVTATIAEIGGIADPEQGLQRAIEAKDTVGGIVECRVSGLPASLGEPFFDSVESVLAHAVFAIPAVRGVEFGTGFAAAKMFGSEHNDAIEDRQVKREPIMRAVLLVVSPMAMNSFSGSQSNQRHQHRNYSKH